MNRKIIWLLCAVLLIIGCGKSQSAKFNEAARMEAETAGNEAVTAYRKAGEVSRWKIATAWNVRRR
jgi:hypothetical protein